MDVYSTSLALAVGAIALAVALALFPAIVRQDPGKLARWTRASHLAAILSLVLTGVAALSHLLTGHPPGSAEAQLPIGFLLEHPSFVTVAVLAMAVLAWPPRHRRRG